MNFHKLNILSIQYLNQKGGFSQHPTAVCAEPRNKAQASHYRDKVCEPIFSIAAHQSALGSAEPLHLPLSSS